VKNRVEHKNVVLIGAFFTCTRCGKRKPAIDVGLRDMGDGTIRNQPQCIKCRALPPLKARTL
jgi:hypothetical protein